MQGNVMSLDWRFLPAFLGGPSTPDEFENAMFGRLRVVEYGGEIWFVAKDVCAALGLDNVGQAASYLDKDEKADIITDDVQGGRALFIVSEPGLYSLIMRSRKPKAKAFKRWITHQVLLSIRKRDAYATDDVIDAIIANPDMGIKLLAELKKGKEPRAQSAATRKASTLENELGRGKAYRQVKAIPWLLDEFEESRAMYQQVGKKLKSISDRMGYTTNMIPCPEYPDGVKAYHIDVIEAFRVALMTDLNMLSKYRKRKH